LSGRAPIDLKTVAAVLKRDGLLLLSDPVLPSLTSLVIGGPIHGSWWGHPLGNEVYHLLNMLADHPEVLMVKLISAKVTFVHRRLWPAVVAVGQARARWQLDGLTPAATYLLNMVDESGRLAWDDIPPFLPPDNRSATESVRALEARLLVHATEVHTPSGAHAKNLDTWPSWLSQVDPVAALPDLAEASTRLESTLAELNERHAAQGRLPWQTPPRRRQSQADHPRSI
jgi:hypothetical protein